jgi:hypothetical protein
MRDLEHQPVLNSTAPRGSSGARVICRQLCLFGQTHVDASRTIPVMTHITLSEFIEVNRDELIGRCRAKVSQRSSPPATELELARGVPLFLDQLTEELRNGPSKSAEISKGAVQHGYDLLRQGFTIGQVVHDYGDICQAITDLAVETSAPIGTDDFRTLNRCLDDAIAAAVTEFGRGQDVVLAGESQELLTLTGTAITAFEALQTGNVGIGGSTGTLVHRSLLAIRTLVEAARAKNLEPKSTTS